MPIILKISWSSKGTLRVKSVCVISQVSLNTKKTLNRKTRYFQFRCLKDGYFEWGLLVLVMKIKTMRTKDIWNKLTVNRENQNKIKSTNTNELLSHMDLNTLVMFIASLKFLLTINIRQSLSNTYNLNDAYYSISVIAQIDKYMQ